jgi:hypothetical protein
MIPPRSYSMNFSWMTLPYSPQPRWRISMSFSTKRSNRHFRRVLEAEAKAKAAAEQAAREKKNGDKLRPGRKAVPPSDVPEPKAQRNFTDPDSSRRI